MDGVVVRSLLLLFVVVACFIVLSLLSFGLVVGVGCC